MSGAFPELKKNPEHIMNVLKSEEQLFGRTLEKGLRKFDRVVEKLAAQKQTQISGEDAVKLLTTYGFPFDLTRLMAEEKGLTVDEDKFLRLLADIKDWDRAHGKKDKKQTIQLNSEGIALLKQRGLTTTNDSFKYIHGDLDGVIKAIWTGNALVDSFSNEVSNVCLVLMRSLV